MADKEYIEVASWYTSVANAIRSKKGTSEPILRDDFASEIASITGGGETPYYDGTVVIEKANSVLGLRRFKESATPYLTITNEDELQTFWAEHYFDISPIGDVTRVTPFVVYGNSTSVIVGNESEAINILVLSEINAYFSDGFEILSTSDSTVDEWLLANTEGVSV